MSAPHPLACALVILAGMTAAGALHSAWLRTAWSRPFAIPLDAGLTLRGRRIFGDNKTLRGIMAIVPGAALSFGVLGLLVGGAAGDFAPWTLTSFEYAILGASAALGFMLGELPNSFVKRQLGIAPGAAPKHGGAAAVIAFAADRLDSTIGVLVAVSLTVPTPWMTWAWVLLLGPGIHLGFSVLLFRLGVKARAI